MDNVRIDPMELEDFEFHAAGYSPDFELYVFGRLESILSYTLKDKGFLCVIDDNKGRHINPELEYKCVDKMVEEISRMRFQRLNLDECRSLMSHVYAWERYRKDLITKAKTIQRDFDSIESMFNNPTTAKRFVKGVRDLLEKDVSIIELGKYVATFHINKSSFIKREWEAWERFWREILRCLNVNKGQTYKRQFLLNESK